LKSCARPPANLPIASIFLGLQQLPFEELPFGDVPGKDFREASRQWAKAADLTADQRACGDS
jgi:hypothetical protein